MTYEQYLSLYTALDGRTTHFVPAIGTKAWHKEKLSREEFEEHSARLAEIQSHDDEWLMREHPSNYIDVFEAECWESLWLRSKLFIIEWKRYEKVMQNDPGQ